jgi:hypothetical protein
MSETAASILKDWRAATKARDEAVRDIKRNDMLGIKFGTDHMLAFNNSDNALLLMTLDRVIKRLAVIEQYAHEHKGMMEVVDGKLIGIDDAG